MKFHVKELTCGWIFNKLLFYAAAAKYIVLTSRPINVDFGGLLYPPQESWCDSFIAISRMPVSYKTILIDL